MNKKKNAIEEKSINDINYGLLKKQFPNAVSIGEDGKYTIDPQKLQMSLDPSKAQIKEDGYGLNWVGKKEAYHNAFTKNYKVLKPLKNSSKNWDKTENILIKGDNIDALKILRHNYFEAIKMIYIDPPYNTKNDGFIYNDNFTATTKQTLQDLDYDEKYIDYIENIQGAKTHSGWLSFMYPRLLLAKDLLKDDGVIFISIDDNEVAQLKLLCDEIFGEDNFIGQIIIKSNPGGRDYGGIAITHEYLLAYGKLFESELNLIFDEDKEFNYEDELGSFDIRELRNRNIKFNDKNRPNLYYPFFVNNNNIDENNLYEISLKKLDNYIEVAPLKSQGIQTVWRWGKEKSEQNLNINIKAKLKADGTYMIVEKYRSPYKRERSIWDEKDVRSEAGSLIIKSLFNLKPFDYPKSLSMLKRIILLGANKDDIILDFFAGSGTTAHAVMDLNASDGGNRKFICVQWAEPIDPKKNKTAYDFVKDELKSEKPSIFDITNERIKRAGQKIVENDLTNKSLDVGFRTFEIVEDKKQKIYQKSLEDISQEDLLTMMQNPSIESYEEILYNLFVAEGLSLCTKYEELIKEKLYLASNVAFVLGDISSDELVNALSDKKECEYITVYSPSISNDKFTLELESNISKLGIKPDKLRFRG